MQYVSITEAKNRLSALLDQVAAGEDVIIMDRGRPVARLEAVGTVHPDPEGRVERLQRAGLLAPARRSDRLHDVLSTPPVTPGGGVLDALLEERAEGR